MKKSFKIILMFMLVVGLGAFNVNSASAAKVMWGKTELKLGQIGKATILADTTLVKLESDGSLTTVRALKKGDEFRVYSYKSNHSGLFGVGGGSYIQKSAIVKYETPSKSKFALLQQETNKDKTENASREFKAALESAKFYVEKLHMSKVGVYDQLVSKHGGKFPEDAAQYAIDNLKVNWKDNALKQAKSYAELMNMSDSALYNQLVSEHGGKFTPEEAQYAIDNL